MARKLTEADFWARVEKTPGCWLYNGPTNGRGYGVFAHEYAHRYSYRLRFGDIPSGMHLDHVLALGCLYRHCVNPDHLEPVTNAENHRRARLSRCRNGHPFDATNTYYPPRRPDARQCRLCNAANARRRRKGSKAA